MRMTFDRQVVPGDLFNISNELPINASNFASSKVKAFITPLFYPTNDVSLMYFCPWESLEIAGVVLHCLESPSTNEKNHPHSQTFIMLCYVGLQTQVGEVDI